MRYVLVLVLVAGLLGACQLDRMSDADMCLSAGGTWNAASRTCGPTPLVRPPPPITTPASNDPSGTAIPIIIGTLACLLCFAGLIVFARRRQPSGESPSFGPQHGEVKLPESTASGWHRFSARVLDTVYAVGIAIAGPFILGEYNSFILSVVTPSLLLLLWLLEVVPGPKGGGSLGYRTLHLRIQAWPQHRGTSSLTARLWGRVLLRSLLFVIPLVNIIYLIALVLLRNPPIHAVDATPVTPSVYVVSFLATLLVSVLIGVASGLIDKNKRSWYDKAAGTVVVKL